MKKISRESLTAASIGFAILIANSWHVITEGIKNKPEELFAGIAHYFADYFLYVSHILQGANGAWLFTKHMYTNEPMPPTWIYWLYTILGKVSNLGIDPFMVYNGSLFFFVAILLSLWWRLIPVILPKQTPFIRLITFIFIITASNFPGLGEFWFSPTPALNRLGGVPHQLFQTLLLLLVLWIFSTHITSFHKNPVVPRILRLLLLAICSFLAATATPIQMLLVNSAAFVFLVATIRKEKIGQYALLGLALAIPSLIGALLTNAEFARQPILSSAKLWEDSQPVSVSIWQFILAVGPISLLIPFGIRAFFPKYTPLGALLGIFGTLSMIVFFSPIPKLLGTTPVRWLSPASFTILPVIAAMGFAQITQVIQKAIPRAFQRLPVGMLLLVIYLAFTIPAILTQIQARTLPLTTDTTMQQLNHIPYPMMKTFMFLQNTAHDDNLVLTDPALPYDALVPILTGLRSFTGHPVHTLYPQTKQHLRNTFFSGSMSETQARQFIKDHAISHVFISRNTSTAIPRYSFLSRVFHNEIADIYAISN
ncbi:hypothetical protein KJZ67_03155 [Patescibacteria group bacterium]|nr:hypothetical protein [Patescibacteria group bacterium]